MTPIADAVTVTADKPVAPRLYRAYRYGRRLVAYAVLDQFGWAIVARAGIGRGVETVGRGDQAPGVPSTWVRAAAREALIAYARGGVA